MGKIILFFFIISTYSFSITIKKIDYEYYLKRYHNIVEKEGLSPCDNIKNYLTNFASYLVNQKGKEYLLNEHEKTNELLTLFQKNKNNCKNLMNIKVPYSKVDIEHFLKKTINRNLTINIPNSTYSSKEFLNYKRISSLKYCKLSYDKKKCNAIKLEMKTVYNNLSYLGKREIDKERYEAGMPSYDVLLNNKKPINEYIKKLSNECDSKKYDSCFKLAESYLFGYKVKKDKKKAKSLFEKSCNKKHKKSCFELARIYEEGKFLKQDRKKSKYIYGTLCTDGMELACDKYKKLNEKGVEDYSLLEKFKFEYYD